MPTHYDTLGLSREADQAQIKSAYRRLVRAYHPDVNAEPEAKERFLEVQKAYEVLSDAHRKGAYDAIVESHDAAAAKAAEAEVKLSTEARRRLKEQIEAEQLRLKAEERMRDRPPAAEVDPAETDHLNALMNSGKMAEAERLAKKMIAKESRQPAPYAVLGEIARYRGEFDLALQYYGLAAQYEPRNPIYERKYEDMLSAQAVPQPMKPSVETTDAAVKTFGVAAFLIIAMAVYTVLAPEKPIGLVFAPTWTLGTMAMLFLSGIVVGSCLTLSGSLARFEIVAGTSLMRVSPMFFLGVLSLVSFWLASLVYVVVGHTQQAFNRSISLMLTTIGTVSVAFALAGWAKGVDPALQNLAWGGNLTYFGALAGWYVVDNLKSSFVQKGL